MSKCLITRRRMITGAAGATALAASGVRSGFAQSPLAGKTIKLVYPFAAPDGTSLLLAPLPLVSIYAFL